MASDGIARVAVVGAGLMGHGIALEFTLAGYHVSLHDISEERLDLALARIREHLQTLVSLERATPAQAAAAPALLQASTVLRDVVVQADVVIGAVAEDLALKQHLFGELDRLCPAHAILASNSSSFLPSSYAAGTRRPAQVLGTHYFNPPYLVPLVEIIRGPATSDAAVTTMYDLLKRVGERPIIEQKEVPGFIANRLQGALLREALWLVAQGVATAQDVDAAITGSIGRRWAVAGVFEVFELAGWDLVAAVYANVFPHLDVSRELPAVLRERVARGDLGVKTGTGFYSWTPEAVAAAQQRIGRALVAIDALTPATRQATP